MQTYPKFNADRSEGQGTFQKYRNNATHVPWDLSNETSDLLSLAVTIKREESDSSTKNDSCISYTFGKIIINQTLVNITNGN